ncbi:platelet-activating factor acetylhydrolase [Gottschalkia purinilytica]|uniref:Platelet-activating factor acetylhydrolase n=1 Tax=Gottschalkia purinilytica TaxID=1503 RepID=A0A0L0WC34_GOTPU|nr:hypothetical protein [Gottschalkia purinilytica]KNF09032.1 platelet-activating factor acetylhydrolase [Gottschalkia purinilytica]
MRTIEFFVIIINFLILIRVLLFRRGLTRNNIILLGVSSVVTSLQLFLEGYRWQMIPAYSVLMVLLLQIFIYPRKHVASTSLVTRIFKGCFIGLYLAAAVTLPLLMPIFSFNKPTGAYEVGTTTFHFIDNKRLEEYTEDPKDKRELMVQLWYPARTGSDESIAPYIANPKELASGLALTLPFPAFTFEHLGQVKTHSHQEAMLFEKKTSWPLLIFSHGMDQFRNQNTFQMEELASNGYIVAAIDHTYDAAATVFPDGRTALNRSQLDDGLPVLDEHISLWTQDVKFVLDKLEQLNRNDVNNRFYGAIDMKRIGMFGHSYGGATAMQILLEDDRVKAGINMDGGLYGKSAPKKGLAKPFMMMDTQDTEDYYIEANKKQSDLPTGSHEDIWNELVRRRQLAMAGGGYSLTIPNTDHMSYTDLKLISPLLKLKDEDPRYVHHIINDVSLSFFDKYVKGDNSINMEDISERYPEIGFVKH